MLQREEVQKEEWKRVMLALRLGLSRVEALLRAVCRRGDVMSSSEEYVDVWLGGSGARGVVFRRLELLGERGEWQDVARLEPWR